jgi:hypothetical protein
MLGHMGSDTIACVKQWPRYIQLMGTLRPLAITRIARESIAGEPPSRDYDFSLAAIESNMREGFRRTMAAFERTRDMRPPVTFGRSRVVGQPGATCPPKSCKLQLPCTATGSVHQRQSWLDPPRSQARAHRQSCSLASAAFLLISVKAESFRRRYLLGFREMNITKPFADRHAAGRALAQALAAKHPANPVVLALPRGGVAVAVEIASALKAPLDIVLVRKVGVPFQRELAVAAVVDGGEPEDGDQPRCRRAC